MDTLLQSTESSVHRENLESREVSEHSQPPTQHPTTSSPPVSTSSSPKPGTVSQRRSASPLSLDLTSLPQLTQPSPPSNTLLITQLNDPKIFHPASLATIRQYITTLAPLHSFSPLKSLRRIVCSFYDIDSAIRIRQHLDGANLLGDVRARVYFGEPTPIGEQKKFLERPDAGRLFFISPPPSPPVGWEVREEGAPNKDVVASDLAEALGKLSGKIQRPLETDDMPVEQEDKTHMEALVEGKEGESAANPPLRVTAPVTNDVVASKPSSAGGSSATRNRSRSSTVIYDPEAHGDSPALPAVMVEDTTMNADEDDDATDAALDVDMDATGALADGKKIVAHTSRPPLELIQGA
jgi:Calcipressin